MTATAHRRRIIAVFTAAMMLTTLGSTAAFATSEDPVEIEEGHYTFAWEVPMTSTEWNDAGQPLYDEQNGSIWPQAYVTHVSTGDSPDLGALDGMLPDCGVFQVDVYLVDDENDKTKVAAFVGGTLKWEDDHGILISGDEGTAWKIIDNGDCEIQTPPPPSDTVVNQGQCPEGYDKIDYSGSLSWMADANYDSVILVGGPTDDTGNNQDPDGRYKEFTNVDEGETIARWSHDISHICVMETTTTLDPAVEQDEVLVLGTTVTTMPAQVLGTTVTTMPAQVLGTTVSEVSADTLPFTGFAAGGTVLLAVVAMLAGGLMLFALRGKKGEEGAFTDIGG